MKLNANETECTILRKNEADQELRLNTAKIVINGKETAKIRKNEIKTITEGDKVTHIVPAIIIGEAVLLGVGYEYPELVSRQMIINFAHKWNDTPVVIYHTWDSAKELETIEASLVGRIYKPEILMNEEDDDFEEPIRLLVELHINEAWLLKQKKGKDTLDRILRGEMIEVSSGYYLTKFLRQSGKFNDKDFGGIQEDADPDHLAILPDQIGAYSIGMGGGLNRMNQEGETQPLITNTEKGAVGMFKKRLLSNGSLSEAVVTAMDEKEAERVLNALEAGSEKARAEEVSRLNAEFITNYPESEAGKLAIENAAKELAVKNADKEDRDNQWKEVEGKVAMTREEFDATPKVGRDVIVNSVKEVEPALKGEKIDNEAPKDTDPDKPEGDA